MRIPSSIHLYTTDIGKGFTGSVCLYTLNVYETLIIHRLYISVAGEMDLSFNKLTYNLHEFSGIYNLSGQET